MTRPESRIQPAIDLGEPVDFSRAEKALHEATIAIEAARRGYRMIQHADGEVSYIPRSVDIHREIAPPVPPDRSGLFIAGVCLLAFVGMLALGLIR